VPQAGYLPVDAFSHRLLRTCLIFAKLYEPATPRAASAHPAGIGVHGLTESGGRLGGRILRWHESARLEIAQSTLHRPRVLFLDEPTVGLDPIARDAVLETSLLIYGPTMARPCSSLLITWRRRKVIVIGIAIMHLGNGATLGNLAKNLRPLLKAEATR